MRGKNFITKQRGLEQPPPRAVGQGELYLLQLRQLPASHQ